MKIEINATKRDVKGTGASRRLRRESKVPGIVYGAGKDAVSVEFDAKALFMEFRHEAFHASIIDLNLDGKKESVYYVTINCIQFAAPCNISTSNA